MVGHGEQARVGTALPIKLMLVDNLAGIVPLAAADAVVRYALLVRAAPLLAALGQVFDDPWSTADDFEATAEPELAPPSRTAWSCRCSPPAPPTRPSAG
jgi:hypothetical protein